MNLTISKLKTRRQIASDSKLKVPSSQTFAVNACAPGKYVLQFGSNHAKVATELKQKLCHVTAITVSADEMAEGSTTPAPPSLRVPRLPQNVAWFDRILLLDLIEQLHAPERFMGELRQRMARRGSEVVITTSNVVSFANRVMLALSRRSCSREAVRGCEQRRLFTFKSLRVLLEQAGFEIVEARGVPMPVPTSIGSSRRNRALLKLNQALLKISKHLFAYEICMRARPVMTVASPVAQESPEEMPLQSEMLSRIA